MKKTFMFFILICCAINTYAMEDNLYEKFKDHREIKIYLEDVINEAKDPAVLADVFRKIFRETIEKRKGIRFVYSDDVKNADVAVTIRIKNYVFTANAMPMMFSSATLVADSLSPKSSGKLVVDYEVRGASDGKQLLSYKGFATDERRPKEDMKQDAGFINSVSKNVNRFIYKAFYKPKNR